MPLISSAASLHAGASLAGMANLFPRFWNGISILKYENKDIAIVPQRVMINRSAA
jgi:hypothetical protein